MRNSTDRFKDGTIYNGYDYNEQAWVIEGIYQDCGHTDEIRKQWGGDCCQAHKLAGQPVSKGKQTEAALS